MSTNYRDTFITVASDCAAREGRGPTKTGSIAAIQLDLLRAHPYGLTSDELLFETHALREGIAPDVREQARATFLAKPRACLRASPLVKQFGWGLHHDAVGRVAAIGIETEAYRTLTATPGIKVVPGMRNRRA